MLGAYHVVYHIISSFLLLCVSLQFLEWDTQILWTEIRVQKHEYHNLKLDLKSLLTSRIKNINIKVYVPFPSI